MNKLKEATPLRPYLNPREKEGYYQMKEAELHEFRKSLGEHLRYIWRWKGSDIWLITIKDPGERTVSAKWFAQNHTREANTFKKTY